MAPDFSKDKVSCEPFAVGSSSVAVGVSAKRTGNLQTTSMCFVCE